MPLMHSTSIVQLGYRTPYRFGQLLGFFRARRLEGVEAVGEDYYARSVRIPHDGEEVLSLGEKKRDTLRFVKDR